MSIYITGAKVIRLWWGPVSTSPRCWRRSWPWRTVPRWIDDTDVDSAGLELEMEYIQCSPSLAFRLLIRAKLWLMRNMTGANEHKWMQPSAEVQQLPVPANRQAAGRGRQFPGGGEIGQARLEISWKSSTTQMWTLPAWSWRWSTYSPAPVWPSGY